MTPDRKEDWIKALIETWYDNPEIIKQGALRYHNRDYNTLAQSIRTELLRRLEGMKKSRLDGMKKKEYGGTYADVQMVIGFNSAIEEVKEII